MPPSVPRHITEAVRSVAPGQFISIAQICAFRSSEYSDERRPATGAVAALLFPLAGGGCRVEGVIAVDRDQSPTGKRGARSAPDYTSSTVATFSDG